EVIARLRAEFSELLTSPGFITRMKQVGIEIRSLRSDEFAAFTREERARWAKTIEMLKLRIE
ncbi:MAG: Tripartite tricarboxylate transporter family receptor, partial [Alphaproteobacteria bacterium]|nr:Tripartite tricarboxylate transporter family receptor [Alphaproteobacteria bacterium]